jgi:hypothetical protein
MRTKDKLEVKIFNEWTKFEFAFLNHYYPFLQQYLQNYVIIHTDVSL